jgi:Family of unknown function (DUF6011)
MTRTASPAMVNYLRDLCAKRVAPSLGADRDARVAAFETWLATGPDFHAVSRRIDFMKEMPVDRVAVESPAAGELTAGVYELPGTSEIFVIKWNKQKTNLYAKLLVEINSTRITHDGEVVEIEFIYAPGAMRRIKPEHKMSLERAKGFMIRYGKCIACGRTLKVAESVERGIGPVCVKYYG